jgi:hypothetical protein
MGGVCFFWLDEMGCLISLLCTSVRLHDAPDCGRAPIHLSSPASTQTAVIRWMCPDESTEKLPTRVASRTSDGLIDAACWLKYSEPCPHPIHPSINPSEMVMTSKMCVAWDISLSSFSYSWGVKWRKERKSITQNPVHSHTNPISDMTPIDRFTAFSFYYRLGLSLFFFWNVLD